MLQHPFEAIIFDCDGTLVDSEPITASALIEQVAELGLKLDFEETLALFVGRDMPMIVEVLTSRLKEQGLASKIPDTFVEEFRKRQAAGLQKSLKAIQGAKELLKSLQKPFCLASNAPRDKIRINLDVTGLNQFFPPEMIFSAYDINIWKPNPDLFLLAAERMKIEPSKCVVIEDSSAGVEAGIAAGMQVVEFAPGTNNEQDPTANANVNVLRIEALVELIPILGN
jgi:HAD superfamily hydrolase (TIGR01509 family)